MIEAFEYGLPPELGLVKVGGGPRFKLSGWRRRPCGEWFRILLDCKTGTHVEYIWKGDGDPPQTP